MPRKSQHLKPTTIRLTPDEQQHLRREADDLNLSFSDYARRILLERPLPRVQSELSVDTYRELGKIGGNINQLAKMTNRAVNMGFTPPVTLEQWEEIQQLIKQIRLEIVR